MMGFFKRNAWFWLGSDSWLWPVALAAGLIALLLLSV